LAKFFQPGSTRRPPEIREQVRFLVDHGDPVAGIPASWVILAHGGRVADAQDSVAARLDPIQDN
jgi:hypothetical protein